MSDITSKTAERSPYILVCFQECERMNTLVSEIRRSLKELDLGLKVCLCVCIFAYSAALNISTLANQHLGLTIVYNSSCVSAPQSEDCISQNSHYLHTFLYQGFKVHFKNKKLSSCFTVRVSYSATQIRPTDFLYLISWHILWCPAAVCSTSDVCIHSDVTVTYVCQRVNWPSPLRWRSCRQPCSLTTSPIPGPSWPTPPPTACQYGVCVCICAFVSISECE